MSRRSELFRLLFDLRCNPFPKEAIAGAGIDSPFYKGLYPDIERRMADAFLGAAKPPPVALLSSLGEGGEARGFGKTRYLLWFADQINQDLGQRSLALAGARDAHSGALAVYVSFDTVGITSLSHLLFDVVCDALAAPLLPSGTYDRRAVETAVIEKATFASRRSRQQGQAIRVMADVKEVMRRLKAVEPARRRQPGSVPLDILVGVGADEA